MSKLFTIIAAVVASTLVAGSVYKNFILGDTTGQVPREVVTAFDCWRREFGKNYGTDDEYSLRLKNFHASYQNMLTHNESRKRNYTLGMNQFADLDATEWETNLRNRSSDTKFLQSVFQATPKSRGRLVGSPKEFNWRAKGVTGPVRDLENAIDLMIYPVIDTLQSFSIIQNGSIEFLSSQQMIDCIPMRNLETLDNIFGYVVEHGLELAKDYPPTGTRDTCKYQQGSVMFQIDSYKKVPKADNDELKAALLANPVAVGINASGLMQYSSGIYDDWNCSEKGIDTVMVLLGYGEENGEGFWMVQANWGFSYGESGYIRLARKEGKGVGMCGITEMAAYPMKDTNPWRLEIKDSSA